MRILLLITCALLLLAGGVAVYRFLLEDTRAFDDARRSDQPASHNLDRGRPNPANIVDSEGRSEHPTDPSRTASDRERSDDSPDGTVYWVRDEKTGGFKVSPTRPSPREQSRMALPRSVELVLRNEGA